MGVAAGSTCKLGLSHDSKDCGPVMGGSLVLCLCYRQVFDFVNQFEFSYLFILFLLNNESCLINNNTPRVHMNS